MNFSPSFKGHFAVVGNTGMGKGVLVSAVCRRYQAQGVPVFLLTCKENEYYTFPADFKTMDEDRFLKEVLGFRGVVSHGENDQRAVGLIAVIDEAWQWNWRKKLEAIPNSGRSRGIEMWAQGTRMMQMPPNVRGNCDNVVVFKQRQAEDVELLAKSYGPEFAIASDLQPGQFVALVENRIQYGTAWTGEGSSFRSIKL